MKQNRILHHIFSAAMVLMLVCMLSLTAFAVAGWSAEDGALYYYNRNGVRLTGEQTVDNTLYTFLPDGRLTGNNLFVETPDGMYCINGTAFAKGFRADKDLLYHFGTDGLRTQSGTADGLTITDGIVLGNGVYARNGSVRYYLENDRVVFSVSDYEAQLVLAADPATQGGQTAVRLSIKNNPGVSGIQVMLTYDKESLIPNLVYDHGLLNDFTHTETDYGMLLSWEDTQICSKDDTLVTLYFSVPAERGTHILRADCTAVDLVGEAKSVKGAGTVVTVNCKHNYDEYLYNHDATCTADGTRTATCTKCGEKSTVPAVGTKLQHSGGDATCNTRAVCEHCGAVYGSYDADDHRNLQSFAGKKPTCYTDGYTAYNRCSDCQTELNKTAIPALNHKNTITIPLLAPTCTQDGHSQYTRCSDCGLVNGKEVFAATGHVQTEQIAAQAPTCTKAGWESYTFCHDCKTALDRVMLPATEHPHKVFMPGKAVTCTEDGFADYYHCPDCNEDLGYKVLTALNHKNTYTVEAQQATCGSEGWSEHVYCPDCGLTVGKTVYPATGHKNIVEVPARATTCTEDGYNAHTQCLDCKTAFDKVVSPATGHRNIINILALAPTCTTQGNNDYTRCLDCNTDFGKIVYPAINHVNLESVAAAEPTCTQDGYSDHMRCVDCGRAFGKTTYPKLDHPGGMWVAAQDATCFADGTTAYFFCPLCLAEEGKQTIPAIAHKNATAYAEIPATCYEDGMSAYLDCPDCGLTIGKQVLPKLNHKNMQEIPAKEGSCLEQGYTAHLHCPDCGMNVGKQPTPKTDHLYTNWAVFEAPCLGLEGKEFRICMMCGDAQYRTLPALTLADGKIVNAGDIDGNGTLNAADARTALRLAVELEEKTEQNTTLADIDKDGKVAAADARLILRAAVGLESTEDSDRFFITESGHIEPFITEEKGKKQ